MSLQYPYKSGSVSVPDASTDFALLAAIFGAGWLDTLQGAPSSIIIQFGRDISYRLISTSNDSIASLNTSNSPSILRFNDMQTGMTDTANIDEIYVTNASGVADTIYVTIFANRFK